MHTLTVIEMPAHSHDVTDPGHSHLWGVPVSTDNAFSTVQVAGLNTGALDPPAPSPPLALPSMRQGGGQAFSIMNPYLVVNDIIKYSAPVLSKDMAHPVGKSHHQATIALASAILEPTVPA